MDENTIRKVAAISRLELDQDDIDTLKSDIGEVLDIFSSVDDAEDIPQEFSLNPTEEQKEISFMDSREDRDYTAVDLLDESSKDGRFKGPKVR